MTKREMLLWMLAIKEATSNAFRDKMARKPLHVLPTEEDQEELDFLELWYQSLYEAHRV